MSRLSSSSSESSEELESSMTKLTRDCSTNPDEVLTLDAAALNFCNKAGLPLPPPKALKPFFLNGFLAGAGVPAGVAAGVGAGLGSAPALVFSSNCTFSYKINTVFKNSSNIVTKKLSKLDLKSKKLCVIFGLQFSIKRLFRDFQAP